MPDTIIPDANDLQVTVTKAHGFVVVAWWADRHGADRKGSFDYTFYRTLNEALDGYDEYLRGEFNRATAMGVFATDAAGLPIRRLDPTRLMKLIAETRAA
jgi:hypothetical protein